MDLTLSRYLREAEHGVFGFMMTMAGTAICETLEHSFDGKAIIPPGTYTCARGMHALKNGVPFETFEVTGVEGHSGLLFHTGNTNADSHGCILVGDAFDTTQPMITGSRIAFARFMEYQARCAHFTLHVLGE